MRLILIAAGLLGAISVSLTAQEVEQLQVAPGLWMLRLGGAADNAGPGARAQQSAPQASYSVCLADGRWPEIRRRLLARVEAGAEACPENDYALRDGRVVWSLRCVAPPLRASGEFFVARTSVQGRISVERPGPAGRHTVVSVLLAEHDSECEPVARP